MRGTLKLPDPMPHRGTPPFQPDLQDTVATVRTGEVCDAVREVELNGVPVRKGQAIGLLERELVAAEETPGEALASLLRSANVEDGDLVTLYWGGDVAEEDAGKARDEGKEYVVQDGDILMFKFNN